MTRLAVLGSPIAHSKSPALHAAAYSVLGLDWKYERAEVTGAALPAFLGSLGDDWRGLSLTMPLKRDVMPLLDSIDEVARLTGGANTVLIADGFRGFNTDVAGIERAFARSGVTSLDSVTIVGAGATAASAVAASHALGATHVFVTARSTERARPLSDLAGALGVGLTVTGFDGSLPMTDAVINTLPGSAEHDLAFSDEQRAQSVLFEVAYDPWPSPLVRSWNTTVVDGLDMLIEQALIQVRIFVAGNPDVTLADEEAVLAAMRDAVRR